MRQPPRFVVAVAIIVFRGDRLLAMRRSPDKDAAPGAWEVLSGRVDPGEQPYDAAAREAFEESGLRIVIDPRPVVAYQAKRNRDDMLVVVYRAHSGAGEVRLSEEHDACAWMTLDEFAAACRFAPLIEAVRRAREMGHGGATRGERSRSRRAPFSAAGNESPRRSSTPCRRRPNAPSSSRRRRP